MRSLMPLAVLALTVGCPEPPGVDLDDDDDDAGEGEGEGEGEGGGEGEGELPSAFRLDGAAQGTDATDPALTADCSFFADFIDVVAVDDGFDATIFGGEVFRNVFRDGNPQASFQALLGGPVSMRSNVLRFVGEQPDDASPFFLALEELEGSPENDGWTGTWSCEPLGIDEPGFSDAVAIVAGTWTLVPSNTP